ncbi:cache domain-containing protein [Geomesophilobacter sediminis]|uniref:histidine kinase n=1 Tax=Geomesophilobacter sediminis TaxID=2798584 RepID=A0A8J7M1Y2_9BACT|nr:cache domain-containing protein [Geomesophilobacter sediminis]MBJ6727127.1 cache domain-containing protein [Geomesophilobacter sediminis]
MKRRFPIRTKLTIGSLVPLFAVMVIVSIAGGWIVKDKIADQAQDKVRTDLNSAREIYGSELKQMAELVEYAASTPIAGTGIATGNRATFAALLDPLQKKKRLDILAVADKNGRILYRAADPHRTAGGVTALSAVSRALAGRQVSGTEIASGSALAVEGPELAQRAIIAVTRTPRAVRPDTAGTVTSGMLLVSAAPVRDASGAVSGVIYGAILLNKDNALVDRIKDTVYEGVRFETQDIGSATIFLDGTRIATNVRDSQGERAIGTKMSDEVYRRVMLEKKKWLDRAFVVNDWYLTAYEPILDLDGRPVGSLYVGMLEKPYAALKDQAMAIFAGILLIGTVLGLGVSGIISGWLARPIKELETFARRVAVGERDLKVEIRSADEVGDLAAEFNQMTASLAQREEEIHTLNRSLEQKVLSRTAELQEKNRLLLAAHEDLARAEKLADLGIVAAGVAHEMNNPLAIIRGNTELLEMYLPEDGDGREEVEVINRQTERMAKIVSNLLTFARQRPMRLEEVAIPRLLDDIIEQAGHQVDLAGIRIERRYPPQLPKISGDPDKLRQVFVNLIVNAVQAMPQGGVLTLTAEPAEEGFCAVSVGDTGGGIPPEHLDKLFTPFFTTKEAGTGLGLSVSYGIVKDHKGTIKPESVPGQGTRFRVLLPVVRKEEE